MKTTGIIIKKELKRVFGDRKLVCSLFVLPAIIVIVIYGIMGKMISAMDSDIEKHESVVAFVNAVPELKSAVDASGFSEMANVTYFTSDEYEGVKAQWEDDILNANADAAVVLDEQFAEKFNAYKNPGDVIPYLNIFFNSTENYSSEAYSKLSSLVLPTFQSTLLAERLGNLDQLTVFTQEDIEIVKEEKRNSEFISMMLPYLITMMLFAGAMSIGVDAIAGEKERGTLARMLLTPADRKSIVFGKLISMGILSGLSSLVYSGAMIIAIPLMGNSLSAVSGTGFGGLSLGFVQIIELIVTMLAMVYLYVAVIGFLATISKDTKTASTYISPIYIVIIVLGMMTMFAMGNTIPTYRYAIPVYGNALAIKMICGNELSLVNFGVSLGATILLGVILTVAAAKAFNNEKLMFNA